MGMHEVEGNARITFAEACHIRRRVLMEKSSNVKEEAEAYGVGRETIRRILRGETFRRAAAVLAESERKILPEEVEKSKKRLLKLLEEPKEVDPIENYRAGRKPPNPLEEA